MFNSLWVKLDEFKAENHIITDGQAIQELLNQNQRFRLIMTKLEAAAQESEEWKARANRRFENDEKPKKNRKNKN